MRWTDVRSAFPDRWLIIEALAAHSEAARRVVDHMAVVETCADGASAFRRYRELHRAHPDRELYPVHTSRASLEIYEERWVGIRCETAA